MFGYPVYFNVDRESFYQRYFFNSRQLSHYCTLSTWRTNMFVHLCCVSGGKVREAVWREFIRPPFCYWGKWFVVNSDGIIEIVWTIFHLLQIVPTVKYNFLNYKVKSGKLENDKWEVNRGSGAIYTCRDSNLHETFNIDIY